MMLFQENTLLAENQVPQNNLAITQNENTIRNDDSFDEVGEIVGPMFN